MTSINNNESTKSSAHSRVSSLLHVGFLANFLLLLGTMLTVVFNYYDMTGRPRELTALIVYAASFAVLLVSSLIELGTDLFLKMTKHNGGCGDSGGKRMIKHGRYCRTSELSNILVSLLFILGVVQDTIAFIFWRDEQPEIEKDILLVAAYTYLLMQLIVMYFAVVERKQQNTLEIREVIDTSAADNNSNTTVNNNDVNMKKAAAAAERLNIVPNVLLFFGLVLNVVNRHLDKSNNVQETVSKTVEFWLSIDSLVASVLYVVADVILLKSCSS